MVKVFVGIWRAEKGFFEACLKVVAGSGNMKKALNMVLRRMDICFGSLNIRFTGLFQAFRPDKRAETKEVIPMGR